jgi:hypothetical protein
VFPLEKPISTAVLSQHVEEVATRIDGELGDEQSSFIEGCPAEWEELPEPAEPLVMGIDGGYVHAREGENRKAGSFEIIVGKAMGGGKPLKRFGFVNTYDTKPKRRVYEVLKSQGMQMNQQVIFLSDGGDDVRNKHSLFIISVQNAGTVPSYIDAIGLEVLVNGERKKFTFVDFAKSFPPHSETENPIQPGQKRNYPFPVDGLYAQLKSYGESVYPAEVFVEDAIGNVYSTIIPHDIVDWMLSFPDKMLKYPYNLL